MPFSIHWRHGCWRIYSSNSICETSKGIYIILIVSYVILYLVILFSTSLIYLFVLKLPNAGGRLIIASDGIWDALSSDMAAKSCRGLPAELAARQVVKVI